MKIDNIFLETEAQTYFMRVSSENSLLKYVICVTVETLNNGLYFKSNIYTHTDSMWSLISTGPVSDITS